jgi:hypothetical protein
MAWIEQDKIRDICRGGAPSDCYHPSVAKFYSVEVPEDAEPSMVLIDGVWGFPPPPPVEAIPAPAETPQ